MITDRKARFMRKVVRRYVIPNIRMSYSQFGEDLIMERFVDVNGISRPSYLDIGANEPKQISNTYYFYERGSRGVLCEPNPYLAGLLKKQRPRDTTINAGIGFEQVAEADFYMFPNWANGLSTFSKEEAMHWENTGMKGTGKIPVEKIIKMPMIPINDILQKHFADKAPDILSLDVEGLDFAILQSMDLEKWRPAMICVETLKYDEEQNGFKDEEIEPFLLGNGYYNYADTSVNTLFARNDLHSR